jgi:hypothetical protein
VAVSDLPSFTPRDPAMDARIHEVIRSVDALCRHNERVCHYIWRGGDAWIEVSVNRLIGDGHWEVTFGRRDRGLIWPHRMDGPSLFTRRGEFWGWPGCPDCEEVADWAASHDLAVSDWRQWGDDTWALFRAEFE